MSTFPTEILEVLLRAFLETRTHYHDLLAIILHNATLVVSIRVNFNNSTHVLLLTGMSYNTADDFNLLRCPSGKCLFVSKRRYKRKPSTFTRFSRS